MTAGQFLAVLARDDAPLSQSAMASLTDAARRRGMISLRSSDRLRLFASEHIDRRPLDQGTIIGSLFRKDGHDRRLESLGKPEVDAIVSSRGRYLVDRYWGSYAAIWEDPDGMRCHVLRAPCGRLPCYTAAIEGGWLVASSIDILIDCGAVPVIDWAAIAGHLVYEHFRSEQTAFHDVRELPGGCRLTIDRLSRSQTLLWSPWHYADPSRAVSHFDEAVGLVRDATLRCVRALAEGYGTVLLGVSGGLDSSIVAACLKGTGVETICFTLVTPDRGGDEREYADALTRHLGLPLHALDEQVGRIDLAHSDAAHLPRPLARAFAQSGDRAQQALASRVRAGAFFTGAGGDNVFAYIATASPIADRLLSAGERRRALETAADIARMTGVGSWTALVAGVRRALRRERGFRWPASGQLLQAEAILSARATLTHPWLEAPAGALPGKATHIAWLMGIENHLEGFAREMARPVISPLMSQPLVEACLRVPTWLWSRGGINRAVARAAFTRDLPELVAKRRGKGTPDGFATAIVDAHRPFIRSFLSEGWLARRGIIDIGRIERLLDRGGVLNSRDYHRLLAFVDVEAWLKAWAAKGATM